MLLDEVDVVLCPAEFVFRPTLPVPVGTPEDADPFDEELDDVLELATPVGLVQFSVKNT